MLNCLMQLPSRVTFDPQVMSGKACIRGMRITVSIVLQMLAKYPSDFVLASYPELEPEDIRASLEFAAYLAQERALAA
jgi:uncharacterized protein (DUF433 family)